MSCMNMRAAPMPRPIYSAARGQPPLNPWREVMR